MNRTFERSESTSYGCVEKKVFCVDQNMRKSVLSSTKISTFVSGHLLMIDTVELQWLEH